MASVELDMIQTTGIGALALIVGMILTRKVAFLQKYCVPSPVSGGILFSLITLGLFCWFDVEVSFDGTLKDVFMLAFFTSVGFQSDLKVLKQGGKSLTIMLVLLVVIIVFQNLMPIGVTRLMGVDSLIGMASGSAAMTGGHGTAAGFAGVFEGMSTFRKRTETNISRGKQRFRTGSTFPTTIIPNARLFRSRFR